MRLFSRYRKCEDGQGLVEFALILPLLMLLLMGLIQFGFIFNGQITLTSAAREGARLAVVNEDDNEVMDRVESSAVALLLTVDKDNITIDRNLPDDDMLSVTVDGEVQIIMPFLNMLTGPQFPLSAMSTMRIEYN